jgi:anti-anti-sigma factor
MQLDVSVGPTIANVCVVKAIGELDIATASSLREAIEIAARDSSVTLRVDLSGVTFIDSTGLRVMLDADERYGTRVEFVPSQAVERLLALTHLGERLQIARRAP